MDLFLGGQRYDYCPADYGVLIIMRKSFIIHNDSLEVLDDLDDQQCGELFRAIRAHQLGEAIDLSPIVKVAFNPFKNQFARDSEKYENIVNRNKLNGSRGGRPKNPKKPSGLSGNPKKPKKADSDSKSKSKSDSDSDSDSDSNIIIPDGINNSAWNEWIDYRQSKKKRVSRRAADKQFKLLANYDFEAQQQIINQSIQNDYQGLFEPKGTNNDKSNRPNQPTGSRRQTLPERVKENIDKQRKERGVTGSDGKGLAETSGDVRLQVHQPIRGDARQYVGELFDGDYTKTDC